MNAVTSPSVAVIFHFLTLHKLLFISFSSFRKCFNYSCNNSFITMISFRMSWLLMQDTGPIVTSSVDCSQLKFGLHYTVKLGQMLVKRKHASHKWQGNCAFLLYNSFIMFLYVLEEITIWTASARFTSFKSHYLKTNDVISYTKSFSSGN